MKNSLLLLASIAGIQAYSQKKVSADSAVEYINSKATICGSVAKVTTRVDMSFIEVCGNHPTPPLLIVIKAADRINFKTYFDIFYRGKNICVTGTVVDYKGKAEIMVTKPEQIEGI